MACIYMPDPCAKKVRQDVMLGVQQVSHFSLDCHVDFRDATIRAAPDRFCICMKSVNKLWEDVLSELVIYVLLMQHVGRGNTVLQRGDW
jgi:hypothetical protein